MEMGASEVPGLRRPALFAGSLSAWPLLLLLTSFLLFDTCAGFPFEALLFVEDLFEDCFDEPSPFPGPDLPPTDGGSLSMSGDV